MADEEPYSSWGGGSWSRMERSGRYCGKLGHPEDLSLRKLR